MTELVKMFESMKLDSFAVKGASPNEYVGALYFPGSQLLVVSAKFDKVLAQEEVWIRRACVCRSISPTRIA